MKTKAIILLALASTLLAGCGRTKMGIQVKGSDTMVNLGQAWAEEFMKQNPNLSIAVTGGGSGVGIASLINGSADIAQASRQMKEEEYAAARKNKMNPREFQVGIDALTVVVHPKNPISRLTIKQLGDIYTGKIKNWKEVGGDDKPILLLSRDKNSGTHVFFLEHVLRGGNPKGPEEFAKSALLLVSSQAIADQVAENPTAIGYFGLGYYNPKKQKALAIAKDDKSPYVLPSVKTALTGEYPISRPLYMYTPRQPVGDVKAFIEFALSPKGQQIVNKMGFVPLAKSPAG